MRTLLFAALALPAALAAQSLDLTVNHTGISIGDSRVVHGIRLNYRDRNMERVDGINATIWQPYQDARGGLVKGIALGIPMTGADEIKGAGLGLFGVGTERRFEGLGLAGIGVGSGGDMRGLFIGGIGVGSGAAWKASASAASASAAVAGFAA
jgi:hypothetical protein